MVGAAEALPILSSNESPFLLNPLVTLALYVLSSVLVLASSLVLYLYGYGRLVSFVHAEQERRAVLGRRASAAARGWGYFTHCAALCALLAIAVCNAPLLHDYTAVYRGSLDGAVLACVVGGISHLLLWVLLWLLLTVKRRWAFRLRVSVARAQVRSPRCVRLVADVTLAARGDAGPGAQPLLVVGHGRTYAITGSSPQRAIMSVVRRATAADNAKPQPAHSIDDINEEQVYWLRPKPPSPKTSPDSDKITWLNRKLNSNTKHKVTFDDTLSTTKKGKSLLSKSPKCGSKGKKGPHSGLEHESEDDGDYATLRELPRAENEENKLLDSASREDSSSTYGLTNKDLTPGDYEDPSPLLTPEPRGEPSNSHPVTAPVTVSVHNSSEPNQSMETPRCLRRADSGMPHDELTPRSDSVSTESSGGSPPCGNHSETSSGVHSNSSSENQQTRRSTSVDDLTASGEQNPRTQPPWRSFSLQRNVQPPTSGGPVLNQSSNIVGPVYGFSGVTGLPSANPVIATDAGTVGGCPAVLLENAAESTVVIRRKQVRPKTSDGNQPPPIKDEPFGRSTNMRMTSFTDNPDGMRPEQDNFPSSSSTLPHYPTQPIPVAAVYPHCSTMPLPSSSSGSIVHNPANSSGGGSCHLFPRQHTTIPTHHNGVRLFTGPNPFVKRFPAYHHQALNGRPPHISPALGPLVTVPAHSKTGIGDPQSNGVAVHHTFPQIMPIVKYNPQQLLHKHERDSANFSMASSGDSDQYLPHN